MQHPESLKTHDGRRYNPCGIRVSVGLNDPALQPMPYSEGLHPEDWGPHRGGSLGLVRRPKTPRIGPFFTRGLRARSRGNRLRSGTTANITPNRRGTRAVCTTTHFGGLRVPTPRVRVPRHHLSIPRLRSDPRPLLDGFRLRSRSLFPGDFAQSPNGVWIPLGDSRSSAKSALRAKIRGAQRTQTPQFRGGGVGRPGWSCGARNRDLVRLSTQGRSRVGVESFGVLQPLGG